MGSLLMTDTAASGPEIGSAPQKGSGLGSKDRTAHVWVAASDSIAAMKQTVQSNRVYTGVGGDGGVRRPYFPEPRATLIPMPKSSQRGLGL